LYCTGYPNEDFIFNYKNIYEIEKSSSDFIHNNKNYSIIKKMGFDAISIWDYRKSKGGYVLPNGLRVDAWGRLYKKEWYLWDGVFKNESIIDNWEHLRIPLLSDLEKIKILLEKLKSIELYPVFSLPGLFEKTWQSMGLYFFAKCIKKGNIEFLDYVLNFFLSYIKELISVLQKFGVNAFIIADDLAYKNREFIPKELISTLLLPKYRTLTNLIHKKNHTIALHSDGYISNLIDTVIDMDFDAIQSLEPDAGVNLIELLYKYHNKICFIGNISNTLLAYGQPSDIKTYINSLLSTAKKTESCVIISPTQQISSDIRPENINIMIKSTKDFYKKEKL
jgi:hypothetical protein